MDVFSYSLEAMYMDHSCSIRFDNMASTSTNYILLISSTNNTCTSSNIAF